LGRFADARFQRGHRQPAGTQAGNLIGRCCLR
jgi:hypothetical protein